MGRAARSSSEAAVSSRVGSEEYRAGGGHAGDRGEQVLGRPEVSRSVGTQCREHVTLKNVPDTTSRLKGRARAKPCSSRLRNTNLYLHKQFVKSETMLP